MARRSNKAGYITIPREIPGDASSLERIGELVESAKNEYKSTHTIADGMAGDVTGVDAEELQSLVDIRMSGCDRVLVVDPGRTAEGVMAACRAVGVATCMVYTEDMAKEPQLQLADSSVCIGPVRGKGAFEDNYRILSAAEVANARAILLVGSRLASDERFVGMAVEAGRSVYRLEADASAATFGGTSKAWAVCDCLKCELPQTTAESWTVCPKCRKVSDAAHVRENHKVCPDCGHHFRMTSTERIYDLVDAESFEEWTDIEDVPETDPLQFPGYLEKIEKMRTRTGLSEGVRCGGAKIAGMPLALAIMDSTFFMGSMGSVVGERITRTVERATRERLPLVIFTCSGGARMQEGLVSLMQMAKISAAIKRHSEARLPYFAVITDPTTGGVTASFAMQGDVIISEPRALIGFAGRRVIQDTIRQELPKEFQTAEFALEHGLIDAIVERSCLRAALANLLALYEARDADLQPLHAPLHAQAPRGYSAVKAALAAHPTAKEVEEGAVSPDGDEMPAATGGLVSAAVRAVGRAVTRPLRRPNAWERQRIEESGKRVAALLTLPARGASQDGEGEDNPAWRSVQIARDTHRPTASHYLDAMVEGFFELHGDRAFGDDGAILAGVGWIGERAVMCIAQEKGRDLQDRIKRNFGCPEPEGYRKSLRLMRSAEHFKMPIVCIVDTQGAFCGKEAEERGQGNAIADNLFAMAGLRVPIISVLVGEGGSGGALALALSDCVAMQEHAVYSVLSPEGFASILWKDRSRAPEAAAVMRMNAYEIFEMGIIDAVLEEGEGSASANPELAANAVKRYVTHRLDELVAVPHDLLLERRYNRFRKF